MNITKCDANEVGRSCGPGTVMLKRDCTDGTNDLCKNIETDKNVSCVEANVPLPDCKGNGNGVIKTRKALALDTIQ